MRSKINMFPLFKEKDEDEKDDDLNPIDELAQLEDAEDALQLPKTPTPGGDIPITPWPDPDK